MTNMIESRILVSLDCGWEQYVNVKHEPMQFDDACYDHYGRLSIHYLIYDEILLGVKYDHFGECYKITPYDAINLKLHRGKFPFQIDMETDTCHYGYSISCNQAAIIMVWDMFVRYYSDIEFHIVHDVTEPIRSHKYVKPTTIPGCYWVNNHFGKIDGGFHYPKNPTIINGSDYGCSITFGIWEQDGRNNITLNKKNEIHGQLNDLAIKLNTPITIIDQNIHVETQHYETILNFINTIWIELKSLEQYNIHTFAVTLSYEGYIDLSEEIVKINADADISCVQMTNIIQMSSEYNNNSNINRDILHRVNKHYIDSKLVNDTDFLIIYGTVYSDAVHKRVYFFSKSEEVITLLKLRVL